MHEGHEQGVLGAERIRRQYLMLALNLIASGIVMYFVMFTMIATTGDFYNNLNTFYMTLMMVTSMAALMLWMMRAMYPNRRTNIVLYSAFAVVFILSFAGMRTQSLVGDNQFLRSMIPHHSGALLMCERSRIRDPEIIALCGEIIRSQTSEIVQMKAIIERTARD